MALPVRIGGSHLEARLEAQLGIVGVPTWVREHRFAPPRRWRFDFAWPDHLLAVEVEGGVWSKRVTAHKHGTGFTEDAEKYNEAALLGWRVLRVVEEHIKTGQAVIWIEKGLGKKAGVKSPGVEEGRTQEESSACEERVSVPWP